MPETAGTILAAASPVVGSAQGGASDSDTLGQRLARNRCWIILSSVLSAGLAIAAVNSITPRYESEARILIDGRDSVILRPVGERSEARDAIDPEGVTDQLQLLLSRDLAREIIKKNKLAERPEFDPILEGVSPLKRVTALFGIRRDPFALTPEERVLDAYYERFKAHAVPRSRVIVIQFQSRDPEVAARVANSIAESYLVFQQNTRQQQTRSARQSLSGEIDNLRKKVTEAESRVEEFRANSSLAVETNSALSNQPISELNAQLNNARALKSEAESKAQLIREMLQGGKPIEGSELLNSELFHQLSEQRVALRGQLAGQSSTLLDGHPRMKELKAQLADLDRQLRDEAGNISRSLDNDARMAATRVDGLSATLEQVKKQANSANGRDVQLRALERETKTQRDLLETYLAKYREANTREDIDTAPSGSRIISRATVSNAPAYPNKPPIVLMATLTALMLSTGTFASGISFPGRLFASAKVPERAPVQPIAAGAASPADDAFASQHSPEIHIRSTHAIAPELGEVEKIAADLCNTDSKTRKIAILGNASGESITLTALTLARLMGRERRVVLVDLSGSSRAVAAVSVNPAAPGLAELMLGEASFSQMITKDRLSRLHLVNAGRPGFDRHLLQSARLVIAVNALLQVYDHVVLDAGGACDLSVDLLAAEAHAVVVPDISMTPEARSAFCGHLKAVGFSGVTTLSGPVRATELTEGRQGLAV